MTTTSRGISKKLKHGRASHTPGKTKGIWCQKRKDVGIALNGNPYKGAGLKGNTLATYTRIWDAFLSINHGKRKETA